jgi:4-hydroxybutyrate CoA-transferase
MPVAAKQSRPQAITATEAAALVRSGDSLALSAGGALPRKFLEALETRAQELEDITVMHSRVIGDVSYLAPAFDGHFRQNTVLVSHEARTAVAEGRADYTPCYLSDWPRLIKDGTFPIDIAVAQLSPPDVDGNCSYGTYLFYVAAAREAATIFIAEINDQVPRTCGPHKVPYSEIDYVVDVSYPHTELSPRPVGPIEKQIGAHLAELIEDGATLQLGAGGVPDALAQFLMDKRHLGLHSEMISNGAIDLIQSGVIDNSKKTLNPGRSVISFMLGDRRLYDFVDGNDAIEMHPIDYTNDPSIICQNPKVVAINSAVQIDLTGQANAESLGTRQMSGVGGQVDFARGAARSPGGKFILAFPSTAKNDKISRIVPILDPGAAVTTPRNDIDYVVTEYGAVRLRGKSLRDRAHSLATIAHPDFRDTLLRHIHERRWS